MSADIKPEDVKPVAELITKAATGRLFSCNNRWPPWAIATVIVTEKELTVIYRDFWLRDVKTVHIENISSVEAIAGPLFGHIKIVSKYVTTDHWTVNWLRRKDVFKIRDLTNELMSEISSADSSGGQ